MASKKQPSPNDQRSIVKNPNNPAHDADQANRTRQAKESQSNKPKKG